MLLVPQLPKGLYIRDATYGGVSFLHGTMRAGKATGDAGIRILVADGAGSISVTDVTQDGKPAGAANVLALPANAVTEGAMADGIIRTPADQDGQCTLPGLPPGRYFVMAVNRELTMDPGQISRLWQARVTRAVEVTVPPGGSSSAEVKLTALD